MTRKTPNARAQARVLVLSALAGLFLVSAGLSAETELDLGVGLSVGYDTNPLRIAGDGANGAFSQLDLQAGVEVGITERVGWFLAGRGEARRYGSGLGNGDFDSAELELGFSFTPNPRSARKLALVVGGFYGLARSTFVDRASGEVYRVVVDPLPVPPTTLALPDRFDANLSGAFFNMSWRVQRRVQLMLETRYEEADYVEDYYALTGLEKLDYRVRTMRPGVKFQLGGVAVLTLEAVRTDLDYRQQPALDAGGAQVPGTLREYGYADLRVTLRVVPAPRWNLRIGAMDGRRDDVYAGFYDYGARLAFASVDYDAGRQGRAQLYLSQRDVDYDEAVVPGSVTGEVRGSATRQVVARYDRTLRRDLGWFLLGGIQDTDSADALFTYKRSWLQSGFRYRR